MFNLTPWRKESSSRALAPRYEHPLAQMRDEFDALFNRFFGNWPVAFPTDWDQPMSDFDTQETENEIVVRAEAPGFEPDDFDVQVRGDTVVIRAERKQEPQEQQNGGSYFERRRFERSFTVPFGADVDKVEAKYRNGVLELHFPRTPEAQGRRIEVK